MSFKPFVRKPSKPLSPSSIPFFTPSALRPSPVPSTQISSQPTIRVGEKAMKDRIILPKARFEVNLPQITWTHKNQAFGLSPVEVNLELETDLSAAGKSDKIGETLSYSDLYKAAKDVACNNKTVSSSSGERTFKGGIQQLASEIAQSIQLPRSSSIKVHVSRPNSLLTAAGIFVTHQRDQSGNVNEEVGINRFRIQSMIGLWEYERHQPQPMELDVRCILKPGASWAIDAMLAVVEQHVERSHPLLLESYLEDLAASMLKSLPLEQVTLEVYKPFGNIYTHPPQVKITRQATALTKSAVTLPLPSPLDPNVTTIMGIINLTPDSFATAPSTLESALALAQEHLQAGATILDLGAMSTRPGALDVPAEIEIQRLLPFIRAIRATEWGKDVILSIDTFRASVADAALEAGANWINDVQAGAHTGDGNMWEVAKKWQCPIIVMHMRGDPGTMTKLTDYSGDTVQIVREELVARINEALEAGVKHEQIIVDPGLGFAKNGETNWELCRRLQEWHQQGALARYPLLVGASRKRFLGEVTGKDASERDAATAGLMLDCIRQGTHVIRVHSTPAVRDIVLVADQLYKNGQSQ